MKWNDLTEMSQLDDVVNESEGRVVVLFKHSTRCSISTMAKSRFERGWDYGDEVKAYYLDLLSYRPISNEIADRFGVAHQSPQIVVLKNGEVIYHTSHNDIRAEQLKEFI